MADSHTKSFFGREVGIILSSAQLEEPFIFLKCIRRKDNDTWEKPSKGEGRTIKLSIEEIICVLEVLKRNSANWRGYHVFKDYKTEIYVGWEEESREVLIIKVGDYKKKLRFPNTNFLTLLLDHILKEKIEFATSGTSKNKVKSKKEGVNGGEYSVFSEHIKSKDGLQVVETTEYNTSIDTVEINAKIKHESPKALLINLDKGNEFWIPKSTVHSTYNAKDKEKSQKLTVDRWIIEKHMIL